MHITIKVLYDNGVKEEYISQANSSETSEDLLARANQLFNGVQSVYNTPVNSHNEILVKQEDTGKAVGKAGWLRLNGVLIDITKTSRIEIIVNDSQLLSTSTLESPIVEITKEPSAVH